jgi:hypothetical protein
MLFPLTLLSFLSDRGNDVNSSSLLCYRSRDTETCWPVGWRGSGRLKPKVRRDFIQHIRGISIISSPLIAWNIKLEVPQNREEAEEYWQIRNRYYTDLDHQ